MCGDRFICCGWIIGLVGSAWVIPVMDRYWIVADVYHFSCGLGLPLPPRRRGLLPIFGMMLCRCGVCGGGISSSMVVGSSPPSTSLKCNLLGDGVFPGVRLRLRSLVALMGYVMFGGKGGALTGFVPATPADKAWCRCSCSRRISFNSFMNGVMYCWIVFSTSAMLR